MNAAIVAVILRVELVAWRNRLVKGRSNRTALVAFLLAVGAFVIGGTVFGLADGASQFLPYARDPMLVGAFALLSILMLVVGFPTVITNFFVGPDLIQLIVAPVRPIEIFLARSVLAMRANLLLGFVIATFVIGVGAGADAGPAYYAVALVLVALQVLLVTAVQTVLLCLILRWVPARLARDVSVVVASLSGAGIYLLWQLTLRQTIGREPDVSGLLSFAHRIDWLPAAWPGHALSELLAGSSGYSLGWLGLTLLLVALLIAIAGLLYSRTLIAGFGQLGGAAPRWKSRSVAARRAEGAGPRTVSPQLAIAAKDWLTYRRDVRRLSRLLPALIFLAGYALVLNRPQRGIGSFWNDAFIVAFVSMFMSMAVATSAVPSERRGFQLLRMAPLKMSQLLVAKIVYTMFPIVGVTTGISIAIAVTGRNPPGDVVELAALALWLGFGFVAIAVAVGAIDPRFDASDDRRMVGPAGTLAGFAAEAGFGLLSVFALAVVHIFLQGRVTTAVPGAAFVAGALVLAAGAAGVVGLLLRTANARLNAFEDAIQSA